MSMRDYPDSVDEGQQLEAYFRYCFQRYKAKPRLLSIADYNQNKAHWDDLWKFRGGLVKNETKMMKRLVRNADGPLCKKQDVLTCLEIHGGDLEENWGWIFGAESDMVSFEFAQDFRSFPTQRLREFILNRYGISKEELYAKRVLRDEDVPPEIDIVYHRVNDQRQDRLDALIWVPSVDLLQFKHLIIPKL